MSEECVYPHRPSGETKRGQHRYSKGVCVVCGLRQAMTPPRDQQSVEAAAKQMDWGQVVANGGPPCFHLCEDGHFCGRTDKWEGHEDLHVYVSLADLLHAALTAHDEALPGEWTVEGSSIQPLGIQFDSEDLWRVEKVVAAHNSALRLLVDALRSAKCPVCDGSGRITVQTSERQYVTREMAMDAGNPEMEGSLYSEEAWEQQQCQWCDERDKALQPYSGQKDGANGN